MKVAMAQMNAYLGDFVGNRRKIQEKVKQAKAEGAEIIVFPEASLFGYHPMDLLERPEVVKAQLKELAKLHKEIPEGVAVLVGAITESKNKKGKPYQNSAVLLRIGKAAKIFAKQLLPTYDVFDEARHIEPGQVAKNFFSYKGKKILVTVCEDIWAWNHKGSPKYSHYGANPLAKIKKSDVDLILNLSASPFTDVKKQARLLTVEATAKALKAPLVYVNMVGAQDELIFDGGSFAVDKKGKVIAQAIHFQEDLNIVDVDKLSGEKQPSLKDVNEVRRQAIVLGLRDFVKKTGFKKLVLGSSGGIDSALCICLAADAVGPSNVTTIALPSKFNDSKSEKLAKQLAENLGTEFLTLPIQDSYEQVKDVFDSSTGHKGFDLVNENLQARLRGLFLMAMSNFSGAMLIATSNKSELAMGYSTLYGDMNGGIMPIGDLLKTEVYDLAKHYNQEAEVIPSEIITRPPSAELAPNQKDSDSLPPYPQLDSRVEKFVEGLSPARGELDKRVLSSLMRSEFKRWQSPPILKVSEHAFGMGRRLPLAHCALK
ncbi:MAG: NAD+ synthase [Bdellovibrionales bacterium]|nr:NAD+ synthase [Bdellovibrionales bacterium]